MIGWRSPDRVTERGEARGVADFVIEGGQPTSQIVGRLVDRGLHDELTGEAYAVIDGADGRAHHVLFRGLEAFEHAPPIGGIVEVRRFGQAGDPRPTLVLATRSDLDLGEQITAKGATWLDHRLVERETLPLAMGGFGRETRRAMEARAEHLVNQGLARRQGQRIILQRDLLNTLRRRELDEVAAKVSADIVHDIKGENWQLTAGFRALHGRVLLFDPTNPKSSAYNPLLEVRRGEWEVRDVQNVADVLVDPEGSLDKRNHWEKTSHSLLVGAILHVLYAEADKTLAGVAAFLSDPKRPIETTLKAMMTTPHLGEPGAHPVVASIARELLNKSENERSGVLSTAMSFLGLYRDPVAAQVTRRCDWRIADLIADSRPATLYLVVPPSDISRTKPLIRLVLNQIGRRLTEDLHTRDRRHRVLMMLDEFPALGRLDFFESALAFMARYGIKSFLIAQSLNQIEKAYGPNNAILDNCHVRVSFATNDERTAKRVSDALGTATEMRAMKNYAGHRLNPWLGHLMVSRQETARPLLTPGEVMQLPPMDEIVMVAGTPPIRAKKVRYYEDRRFTERVLPQRRCAWS